MRKRIVIDRADRLFQIPSPVAEFYPTALPIPGRKIANLDLAHPQWGTIDDESDSGSASQSPTRKSIDDFKEQIAVWAKKEFSITLDPEKEVFVGRGVRELLKLAAYAYLNPGDLALYPNPGYPIYRQSILTYGAEAVGYHLTENREFKPRMKQFSERLGQAAKVMFLNNPHNPSGAELDEDELDELLWQAARDNILLLADATYYAFRGTEGTSILSSPSGRQVGIEFYSMSYLDCGEKLPVAFAIGPKDLIAGLEAASRLEPQSPNEQALGKACKALENYPSASLRATRSRIRETWPMVRQFCEAMKLNVIGHDGFPYCLARIPQRKSSQAFATATLRKHGVVTLPGIAFGDLGEGYLRLTSTTGQLPYREAIDRMQSRRSAM